jgi:hypothetical protein
MKGRNGEVEAECVAKRKNAIQAHGSFTVAKGKAEDVVFNV